MTENVATPSQEYVLGFMFNPANRDIVLITKRAKSPFPGMLNGVGGSIEPSDDHASPNYDRRHVAMAREFEEEAGIPTSPIAWTSFATIVASTSIIHCFYMTVGESAMQQARTVTDERIGRYDMHDVITGKYKVVKSAVPLIAALACRLTGRHITIHA